MASSQLLAFMAASPRSVGVWGEVAVAGGVAEGVGDSTGAAVGVGPWAIARPMQTSRHNVAVAIAPRARVPGEECGFTKMERVSIRNRLCKTRTDFASRGWRRACRILLSSWVARVDAR